MSGQLLFPELEAAPAATDRLYFAILPDADAAARIAKLVQRLRGEHGLTGNALAADRLHISLHHVGDHAGLPQNVVAEAREAAAAVATAPFDVAFDHAVSFGKARKLPLALSGGEGVAGLMDFQRALGAAMARVGLGRWTKAQFTPHITLMYDERRVAEQAVEAIGWSVREFVLVHSLIGRSQSVPLARWALRDG